MQVLKSNIRTESEEFKQNEKNFLALMSQYREAMAASMQGGGESAVAKHKKRNKLLARERIDLLIDPNTPFLELSPMAAYGTYNNDFPSAGIITGIGVIQGREAVIVANDATVKGGTYMQYTVKKHLRAQEIAMENHLPCVYMVDSGGAFLPEQDTVFPDRDHFGRFSTGEVVTAEELGGGEMHTSVSGVADHLAENDQHALQICRNIFKTLEKSRRQKLDMLPVEAPLYDPHDLYGLAPIDFHKLVDPREIIARIVDGSRFQEFKSRYATTLVCGFAHLMGFPVGIIANYGVLFSESALKATHFIELCCQRNIPLVFLQNITGFMVGKQYEQGGIAKDGAKMVHAVSNANVPKFTVIFGGSFGAGNYGMAGRAYSPRLLFMWPNAKISVMGGEQAASVLATVKEDQYKYKGLEVPKDEIAQLKKEILAKYDYEGSAFYSTARLWDDGIIDPIDTRKILALGIAASLNQPFPPQQFGVFRM